MSDSSIRYEVDDTVLLGESGMGAPALLGRVQRTYHALDSHDPVEDCLTIAYVPVAIEVIQQFIASGRPPKGYVFVEFAHEECGHALLPENAVTLVSRALAIGDTVKQDANSAMFGTIVNVDSEYLLHPICLRTTESATDDQGKSFQFTDPLKLVASEAPVPGNFQRAIPESLRSETFTKAELRRAEDFEINDHVVSHDWFGVIELTDIDVAVLLENNTVVWVEKPWELEIIVRNSHDMHLITWPKIDVIARPDILNTHQNGLTSMQPKRLSRGDLVITNKRNLKEGRWLNGEYNPNCLPQGRVLDVRTRRLDINWLVPNAFVGSVHEHMPSNTIKPYENLTSFRDPRDLRRTKDLSRYDHDRMPSIGGTTSNTKSISTGDVFYAGDRVRLREPISRPTVPQIASTDTHGFDMNEYRIFMGRHSASVLWQDGTVTRVDSTNLRPYSLPESDLCPGDLVLAKEGLKMVGLDAQGMTATSDFNEMSFFERDHTLLPSKVGVIQSVDAQERLTRVRWYANPDVKLGAYGQVLQHARFGKIGEEIEDVSFYEIITEPALIRKRGDLVIVPPLSSRKSKGTRHNFPAITDDILIAHPPGPTTLSYLRQMTSHVLPALWEIARPFADLVTDIPIGRTPVYDWIGEIIDIGLDGRLTVRMGGLKLCKDVDISQQDVLLIIDENAEYSDPVDDEMDIDVDDDGDDAGSGSDGAMSFYAASNPYSEESAIDEIVEYEGGERLDNASGEDEWSTDNDTPDSSYEIREITMTQDMDHRWQPGGTRTSSEERDYVASLELTEIITADMQAQLPVEVGSNATETSETRPLASLASPARLLPVLQEGFTPSSFEILEQIPPLDQYNQTETPIASPAFLKRIGKEHRILESSLPEGEIYVRTYESRLDLLRCLIVGPADTPYEFCPFVIDLHLGPGFPKEPPKAHFHSWTSGLGRINPNLYEEGKICLSLLGTWPGQSEQEGWSDKATILQLLISLQGLVFVSQPFYNEAGFETYSDEKVYSLESQQYSEKAYVMARGFVKYALLNAPSGLEDLITWLYLGNSKDGEDGKTVPKLLAKVIQRAILLMNKSADLKVLTKQGNLPSATFLVDGVGETADTTKTFLRPLSQGAIVMLKKIVLALEKIKQQYEEAAIETQSTTELS